MLSTLPRFSTLPVRGSSLGLAASTRDPQLDGMIAVDSDGRFVVHNPEPSAEPDRYAVLVVPDDESPVLVEVNGVRRHGEVVVEESDQISFTGSGRTPMASFKIQLNDQETEAVLILEYVPGEAQRVNPAAPTPRLVLGWTTELIPSPPVPGGAVLREMDRLGIVYGRVSDAVLEEFLHQEGSGTLVVARSYPEEVPLRGPYWPRPLPSGVHRRSARGTGSDWVETGTILGVLKSSAEESLYTVTGRLMDRRAWQIGPGVAVMDGGQHLVAECSGRIEWTEWGVRIFPECRLEDGILTGDSPVFVWDGDVIIDGSLEGVTIMAGGDVMVTGHVVATEIHAGRSVVVTGNTEESVIAAGSRNQTRMRLRAEWQDVATNVLTLVELFRQCQQVVASEDRPLPKGLWKRLMDYKFPDLPARAERLIQMEASPLGWASDPRIKEVLMELLGYLLAAHPLPLITVSTVAQVAEKILNMAVEPDAERAVALPVPVSCRLSRVRDSEVYVAGSAQVDDEHHAAMGILDPRTFAQNSRGGQ